MSYRLLFKRSHGNIRALSTATNQAAPNRKGPKMDTTTLASLTEQQRRSWQAIDELDMEPIVYNLTTGEDGGPAEMTLAMADAQVALYRQHLRLIVIYPETSIVPSNLMDRVWHHHLLDTMKYWVDCEEVFGFYLHHFPYFGVRGPDDAARLQEAYEKSCQLHLQYFGNAPAKNSSAGECDPGYCNGHGTGHCGPDRAQMLLQERPRPDRTLV